MLKKRLKKCVDFARQFTTANELEFALRNQRSQTVECTKEGLVIPMRGPRKPTEVQEMPCNVPMVPR